MNRIFLLLLAGLLMIPGLSIAQVEQKPAPTNTIDDRNETEESNCSRNMNWTDAQKNEFNLHYERVYLSNKSLLDKYVEYGAMTRQEADHRLSHLKKYIDYVKTHNYRWCREDEGGEFEWFDMDDDD